MTDMLRLCSTCLSYSQASFSHCTQKFISTEFELTFVELRYYFEASRPSKTTYFALSLLKISYASCSE